VYVENALSSAVSRALTAVPTHAILLATLAPPFDVELAVDWANAVAAEIANALAATTVMINEFFMELFKTDSV